MPLLFLMLMFLAVLFAYGIGQWYGRSQAVGESQVIEIRDYQGEKLSSVADFRENSIKGPQKIDPETYRLTVSGLVNTTREYSYQDVLESFPHHRKVVRLFCVEGWDVTILWDGVAVNDLISASGPNPGADTVIFRAADGYSTGLPLSYIRDREIILAYAANNVTLSEERGFPFQLVAEDRWGYKWIKWVKSIEVSTDSSYEGYWESRGYSNDGSLNQSFFG